MVNFDKLKEPFAQENVSWRAQHCTNDGTRALALAYIDARDVMERLDAVCKPGGWQCRYSHANGKTVCDIGIQVMNEVCGVTEWVWKADGAGDSDIEAEKGALSDAFKRAAVRWGVGRYLYDDKFKDVWVPCDSYKAGDKYKCKKFTADPWAFVGKSQAQPVVTASAVQSIVPIPVPVMSFDVFELKTLVAQGMTVRGLGDFESKFINDWNAKIAQYGDRVNKPSNKQMAILQKIAAKATATPAHPDDDMGLSDIPTHVMNGATY